MVFRIPLLLAAIICLAALGSTVGPADAGSATITVDTTSDLNLTACTGAALDCSLRGALNIATPNDTINFAITATCFGDICGIPVGSQLPPIDDAGVTINGYTQPNAVPNSAGPGQPTNAALKVVLNGTNCGFNCDGALDIRADNVTIKGLDIILFNNGPGIQINDADNAVIEGNWSGVSVLGLPASNYSGVLLYHGAGNRIGGTTNAARNVISGNKSGIDIGGSIPDPATNNLIQGNLVGLNPAGSAALGNTFRGILLSLANDNIVGGSTPGARNVVSGQGSEGIAIVGTSAGNTVIGNYVGTDITGAVGLGNEAGVVLASAGPGNTVGGDSAGERNIISGNDGDGVAIYLDGAQAVLGNFIGTNPAGTAAVPNAGRGVYIQNSLANIIGGTTGGARNVISGNEGNGIYINLGSTANTIQGNYVGTNAAGETALPNGGTGVYIEDSQANLIGGSAAGARNVISGNAKGIFVTGGADNEIYGNFVGTNAAGNSAIPNTQQGIDIDATANTIGATGGGRNLISGNGGAGVLLLAGDGNHVAGNLIGTTLGGAPLGNGSHGVDIEFADNSLVEENTIAYNGDATSAGVLVPVGTGNTITANSIHSNGGLGIDVFHQSDGIGGVSPNDPGDADTGGNNAQNFPELTSAIVGGGLNVEGFLDSTPHTHFRLEFFSNDTCDASNHGEGQTFLGATNLFLDIDGVTNFAATINADPQPGDFLTSTATNLATGDTSEFSACIEIEAAPTTPTPIPTDTPTPSPTPTGTPSSNVVQGDVNCDGGVDQEDFQFLIEFAAGLNDGTTPDPCPDLGEAIPAGTGGHPWGDFNCDGFVNALDALYLMAHTVDIELPHPGCPAIGSVLT